MVGGVWVEVGEIQSRRGMGKTGRDQGHRRGMAMAGRVGG